MRRRFALVFAAAAAFLSGCETVPVSGRSQLILVGDKEISALAAGEFSKMKKVPGDSRLAKIREIGLKVVAAARPDDRAGVLPPAARWEFAIIDDKTPNAFAMPGGKIGFNTGMFAFTPTDDDIAVILGHEVAHVLCRHGAERVSQGMMMTASVIIADQATRNKSESTRNAWMVALPAVAQVGVMLPYSRAHESESDKLGLFFMARAGYNPEAAPAFWARFAAKGGSKTPEFLSTHPSDSTRIANLRAWMPQAKAQMPRKP
ncbi:MAG: M48 family metallopeptidase [Verrucomicrobiota bacterium]